MLEPRHPDPAGVRLILASRSPRRVELLRGAGFAFEAVEPGYADAPPGAREVGTDARAYAMEEAAAKVWSWEGQDEASQEESGERSRGIAGGRSGEGAGGRSALGRGGQTRLGSDAGGGGKEGVVVLAADTVCVGAGGKLLGKPAGRARARGVLRGFVEAPHAVVTAVAIRAAGGIQTFADAATVRWGAVSDRDIEAYLDSGAWRDKAGGYNLTERQAAGWPITVEGDPTTVVGLPMAMLVPRLQAVGIESQGAQVEDRKSGKAVAGDG